MPPDGAERLLVEVLRYRSSHYRYQLLCLAEGGPLVEDVKALGVPVSILGKKRGLDLAHGWALYRWLREHRPSVVHTHLFTADAWGRTLAWLARVPGIFSTVHSTNSWKSRLHLFIDRCLAQVSDQVIACSSQVELTLREQGIPQARLMCIANGVDLQRIAQAEPISLSDEFSIPNDCVKFALVGRLHEAKGHTDLIPVLQELATQGQRFVVLFIGEGELEQDLKSSVQACALDQHVVFTGFRKDVIALLKSIDFLLMPSRWEGLPITLLESMACGTPVLASRVGGIPDVIEHGQNGLLFEAGSQQQLRQELLSLLQPDDSSRQKRRAEMGNAARETVVARYSAESVAAAYDKLYDQVS